eukprot:COSAG01_NODE_34343_length_549_cov_1.031111_1_plen_23_part_10
MRWIPPLAPSIAHCSFIQRVINP